MKPGDRVRLTERAAQVRTKGYHRNRPRVHVDWVKRRGTVTGIGKKYVYVLWDGLLTSDPVAHTDIERVEP